MTVSEGAILKRRLMYLTSTLKRGDFIPLGNLLEGAYAKGSYILKKEGTAIEAYVSQLNILLAPSNVSIINECIVIEK